MLVDLLYFTYDKDSFFLCVVVNRDEVGLAFFTGHLGIIECHIVSITTRIHKILMVLEYVPSICGVAYTCKIKIDSFFSSFSFILFL